MRKLVLVIVFGFVSFGAQASHLSDAEAYELAGMYSEMQRQYNSGELGDVPVMTLEKQLKAHSGNTLQMVKELKIELPMERIRTVFKSHGVLQLREFNGRALLIGCGNNPVELKYKPAKQKYLAKAIDSGRLAHLRDWKELPVESLCDHRHDGYDTINPDLSMNPTLVAAFAINKLRELLPQTYEKVTYEGIDPLNSPEALEEFEHHCAKALVYDSEPHPEDCRVNQEKLYGNIEQMIAENQKIYQKVYNPVSEEQKQGDESSWEDDSWDNETSPADGDSCPLCHKPGGCNCP